MARSLAYTHRKLSREWHPTKNGDLTPKDVTRGSGRKVWWQCPVDRDHVWAAAVGSRTGMGTGCPYCAGKRPSKTNCLAARCPEIAAQWHPTRNGELTPKDVTPGSQRVVWWKCNRGVGHEWESRVAERTRPGRGCPFCSGRRASSQTSLAALHPKLASQWHPHRNGDLTPADVRPGSGMKVWWKCNKAPDHEWAATIASRVSMGVGCPFCSGRRASAARSLAVEFPDLLAEWHPTRNGRRHPAEFTSGSSKKVWWRCSVGADHVWQATITNRTSHGAGCPFCAGQRVSETNSLATRYPALVAEWESSKNGQLTPHDIVSSSSRQVWWRCPNGTDHVWRTSVYHRTHNKSGCPYCAGRRVSVTNAFAMQNPALALQWHPTRNGDLTPQDVVTGSGKRVWWKCAKGPDHEWEAIVQHRSHGSGNCPYCAGRRASVTNCLATLFPKVAWEWDPDRNGDLTPEDVIAASNKRYWWRCALGHVWQATVCDRTVKGRGCPVCARGG